VLPNSEEYELQALVNRRLDLLAKLFQGWELSETELEMLQGPLQLDSWLKPFHHLLPPSDETIQCPPLVHQRETVPEQPEFPLF